MDGILPLVTPDIYPCQLHEYLPNKDDCYRQMLHLVNSIGPDLHKCRPVNRNLAGRQIVCRLPSLMQVSQDMLPSAGLKSIRRPAWRLNYRPDRLGCLGAQTEIPSNTAQDFVFSAF